MKQDHGSSRCLPICQPVVSPTSYNSFNNNSFITFNNSHTKLAQPVAVMANEFLSNGTKRMRKMDLCLQAAHNHSSN